MDSRQPWYSRRLAEASWAPSPLQVGLSHFNRFAAGLGVFGLLLIAAILWVRQSVDEQIRIKVDRELNAALAGLGLHATLDDAHFVPGEGILFRGLTIADNQQSHLVVDRILVRGAIGWHQLLLGQVEPQNVEVRGAKLICVRDLQGRWNFESWLAGIGRQPNLGGWRMVPVQLRQCQVEIRVQGPRHTLAYALRDLSIAAMPRRQSHPAGANSTPDSTPVPSPTEWLDIQGGLTANGVQQVNFQLSWNLATQRWSAAVAAVAAAIDSKMLSAATELVGEPIRLNTQFRGILDLQCSSQGSFHPLRLDAFQVDGSLNDFEVSDPAIPTTIREARAKFRLTPTAIDVWDVEARSDEGNIVCQFHRDGLWDGPWRWTGTCRRVRIDSAIAQRLPPALHSLFTTWRPEGLVDLEFDVRRTSERIVPHLRAGILDASFEFEKFPYRIEHCVGQLVLQDDHCTFQMEALDDNRIVRIAGDVRNPGKDFTGGIDILVDGLLPLDAKLFRALEAQPKTAQLVQRFHPTGHVQFEARIERDDPRTPQADKEYRIQLVDCSVRHDLFDYPFYNVNGELRLRNDSVDVRQVTGVHGNGSVQCDGRWTKADGLELNFAARSVNLDDQLLAALPSLARARWTELRPTGVVDLVHVRMIQANEPSPTQIDVDAELTGGSDPQRNSVSIRPTWFDYSIHNLSGHVRIASGAIQLQAMRGQHGGTWFSCDGQGTFDASDWRLELTRIFVGGVNPDEELLTALPPALANAARRLSLTGLLNVGGTAIVRGGSLPAQESARQLPERPASQAYTAWNSTPTSSAPHTTPRTGGGAKHALPHFSGVTLDWDLRVDFDNLRTHVGTPIENICGFATLRGQVQPERFYCRGDLNVDSAMIARTQLTQIQGPIYLDDHVLLMGSRTSEVSPGGPQPPLASQFCGGTLLLDGKMDMQDQYPFVLDAQLEQCDMSCISDELVPKHKNLLGLGYAKVRLAGDTSGRHSWRGTGEVYLRGARIEVPIMSALGQVLRETELDRTVFDESNITFDIRGENIDFNQIEMIGSPISLIGNGRVNHNREIDLDFYTILGRNRIRIPIVTDLYRVSSQQFLHIKVDGDLDNPRTHKTVLPGINEPLQRLAEDLEPREVR